MIQQSLQILHNHCSRPSTSIADSCESILSTLTLHHTQQALDDSGSTRSDGVAKSHCSSVKIDLVCSDI